MKLTIPGKWILTGEHAVVRGAPAIVFPLHSRSLTLTEGEGPNTATDPLSEAVRKVAATLENPTALDGVRLTSDIPVRAGLGSSAALSVALARYLNVPEKALDFENIFHGTSSGLDLAAVSVNGPIYFRKGFEPAPVHMSWLPRFYLHDTGTRSSTKECVEMVSALQREDLDQLMMLSVETARASLKLREEDGLPMLIDALLAAAKCFREWNLMNEKSDRLEKALYDAGALAVKPTGSGNGGFLLSLWDREPPEEFRALPALSRDF